jgi:ketosteroid isomerase-like protein
VKGADAVWEFLRSNIEVWERREFVPVGPIEVGDGALVALIEAEVRGAASGAELTWRYYVVTEYEADKLTRISWYADHGEALAAAGIEPSDTPG